MDGTFTVAMQRSSMPASWRASHIISVDNNSRQTRMHAYSSVCMCGACCTLIFKVVWHGKGKVFKKRGG